MPKDWSRAGRSVQRGVGADTFDSTVVFVLCSSCQAEKHALREERHWAEDWPSNPPAGLRQRLRRWGIAVGLVLMMPMLLAGLVVWFLLHRQDAVLRPTIPIEVVIMNATDADILVEAFSFERGHLDSGAAKRLPVVISATAPAARLHGQGAGWSATIHRRTDGRIFQLGSAVPEALSGRCEVALTVGPYGVHVGGCVHTGQGPEPTIQYEPPLR